MNTFSPLLAAGPDIETIIKILIALLIFVIPAVGQLLAKMKSMQPPAEPVPAQPVRADVANEIDDFMRRAGQHRGTRPATPPSAPPVKAAVVQPVPAQAVVEPQPIGGQLSEHVRKYLDEQEFRRHSEQLGGEVAQTDRQIDQHLHQVFDHHVSKLEEVTSESAAPPTIDQQPEAVDVSDAAPMAFVAGLVGLVTNPESLRQAVILNEILHRPEERWE